jgi:Golgi apparatus protein 1
MLALVAITGAIPIAPARAQSVVRQVAQSCAKELQTYCKDVTAGNGRIASCLYAYEDKLTLGCAVAVYQGILDLETATARLEMYAHECDSDLLQYCSDVVPGQGNLYQCLAKNKAKLTEGCAAGVERAEPELRKLGIVK